MAKLLTSLRAFVTLLVLLGIIYPLIITGISQMMMPFESNGSLIEQNGKIIGSELIGQQFTSPRYFHSRPSSINYEALISGASRLAPSSKALFKEVRENINLVRKENGLVGKVNIPADMVTSSASGLDPHISLENAKIQAPRIAKVRNISLEKIDNLLVENTEPDFIGIWGHGGVNVLKLNLDLDALVH